MSTEYITKTCTKCNQTFPATLEYFPKRKESPDGLRAQCRACYKAYKSAYHYANHERELNRSRIRYHKKLPQDIETHKKWREENREYLLKQAKQYYAEHREESNARRKDLYYKNREAESEKRKLDRKENPEKYKVYRKTDQERHKERISTYAKEYREAHKAQIYEVIKQWKANNRERVRIYSRNREAKLKGAEGDYTYKDIERMAEEQDYCCYYCGEANMKLTTDHKIPISRGGSNRPENLCLACGYCNSSKGAKTEEEFWEYLRKQKGS